MMKLFVLTMAFISSMLVERGKGLSILRTDSCWYRNVMYDDGESFQLPDKNPCVDYMCSNGQIHVQIGGCQDNRGNCRLEDDRWEDDCVFYKCERISEEIYLPRIFFSGCLDNNGECQDIGYRWTDNNCTTFQCQLENNLTVSRFVSQGCYHADNCREVNSTWNINCRKYQCRKRGNLLRVRRISGKCTDANGVCRSNGERFTWQGDNCTCTVFRKRNYATEIYCN